MRVRGFTQDDGHIFCTEDQILDGMRRPTRRCCRRSTRTSASPTSSTRSRLRPDEADRLRRALGQGRARADGGAARAPAASSTLAPGDGAFYGPKIEYTLQDALGRQWQCGTMQVDFIDAGAARRRVRRGRQAAARVPVMLHRAIVGIARALHRHADRALRRRDAGLAGAGAGRRAATSRTRRRTTPKSVAKTLQKQGFRVESDLRNEKITYKIREHSACRRCRTSSSSATRKRQAGTVAVRARGGTDLGVMPHAELRPTARRRGPASAVDRARCALSLWALARRAHRRRLRSIATGATQSLTDKSQHRLNGEINAPEVRLVGIDNEPLGIVKIADAMRMSEERDVDLVEIAPQADPPVCRLMDYGKFKYQEQKKAHEAKRSRRSSRSRK